MTNPNRIAVITGGSRGLGRSMAEALAGHGVDVVLTYQSAEGEAAKVVKAIEAKGRKAAALRLDVSKTGEYPKLVESLKAVLATWGRSQVDVLVNNAGTGLHAPFEQTTEAQFDTLVNVHLKSAFFFTQAMVPLLGEGARVLNVSTGLARFSLPGYSAYAAMKGAVETLTKYQARELAARKIRVNVVAPGAVETDFGGGRVRDDKQLNAMVASTVAMGRVGVPEDIGPAVAALVSPELQWMTGQRIELSGGTLL